MRPVRAATRRPESAPSESALAVRATECRLDDVERDASGTSSRWLPSSASSLADARAAHVAVERERERARDGRRGHGEQVGARALALERSALVDAEAVLLVDDDEAQRREGDVVGEERRGSEEHARLARGDRLRDAGALVGGGRAGHERPGHVRGLEHGAELLGVLAREHRGRRHHRGLRAGVCGRGQRERGDGGLAGAHVAEEQPAHDDGRGHVGEDLVCGHPLLVRELEGKRAPQRAHVLAVDHMTRGIATLELDAPAGEKSHLQAQQLVIGKAAACALLGGERRREVDLAQGARLAHELVARDEADGKEVADVSGIGERRRDDAAHPGGAQALAHRVDREDARVGSAVCGRSQHLVEGRLDLLEAVGEVDLARERHEVALGDLLGDPGLTEERRLDDARVVENVDLDDLHAGLGALELDPVDLAHHGDLASDLGHADGHDVGEVEVAVGHVQQEVADARDLHALESSAPRARHKAQARDVIC